MAQEKAGRREEALLGGVFQAMEEAHGPQGM